MEARQELNLQNSNLMIEENDNPTAPGKAKGVSSVPYSVLVVSVAGHWGPQAGQ